jgi:hypothetical protein
MSLEGCALTEFTAVRSRKIRVAFKEQYYWRPVRGMQVSPFTNPLVHGPSKG